jgi:pyruvate kinase
MSATKIVATIGPATSSQDRIEKLINAGVDVVRLNFSHGSHEDHAHVVRVVRETAAGLGKHVAVLQDLQGPRIRTGPLGDGVPLELKQGSEIVISHELAEAEEGRISSTYPDIYRFLSPGNRVLLDDGRLEAEVLAVEDRDIRCRVVKGGLLGAFQGINLPGVVLDIPTFTDKDRDDLEAGLQMGVDWAAMSFVRSGEDANPLRELMRKRHSLVPLIAKVERAMALRNLEGILNAFDGVMVARGDMGVELSQEEVPVWQKTIIRRARQKGKISIVATQMLESMINEPRPTRAEVSDVANAVWDGADAVMLSGETAIGSFPVEAAAVMERIIDKTKEVYVPEATDVNGQTVQESQAVASAACNLAHGLRAQAIAVLTRSGVTAHRVSKCRPSVPILALTREPHIARRLNLWWGVVPVLADLPQVTVDSYGVIERVLLEKGLAKLGDKIVVVGSSPLAARVPTNFLKVLRVGAYL